MPFALHTRVGIGDPRIGIEAREVVGRIGPHLIAVALCGVVVAEAVALLDDAVGVQEVYLTLRRVATEVTLSELIDVIDEVRTEEVTYLGIVRRAVVAEVRPTRDLKPALGKPVGRGRPSEFTLVSVAVFDHIECLTPRSEGTARGILHRSEVPAVHLIEAVPIDIADVGIRLPQLFIDRCSIAILTIGVSHAREVGGEVAVVVRTWVGSVVPVQR